MPDGTEGIEEQVLSLRTPEQPSIDLASRRWQISVRRVRSIRRPSYRAGRQASLGRRGRFNYDGEYRGEFSETRKSTIFLIRSFEFL
ncbi:unnamed protein product [Soboliphyme baturini]|uniref:Uncharacterized protein n=1 Tax=Soboliphyme baturini TaxID=241478 RepID=A0A183IA08_9BILA|nr:unnamed protein product [Soboliphyme baturini]